MKLITKAQQQKMIENGRRTRDEGSFDPYPVIELFTPDAQATWLLTELDPEDQTLAFGLCDIGMGCPELGYVSLTELTTVRGKLGLPIERDISFKADKSLSAYADEACASQQIIA